MAKTTKRGSRTKAAKPKRSARKGASKSAPKKGARASKGSRKAPKGRKTASKAGKASARPKGAKRPAANRFETSAMPAEHAASKAAAQRAVARPTKAHHEIQMERAEQDHQDPRLAGIPGVSHEGSKVQVENYGQFKNKAVARLDKPTNWFRRAAKPKS